MWPEGTENVQVNAPIALLLEEGEDSSALQQAQSTLSTANSEPVSTATPSVSDPPQTSQPPKSPDDRHDLPPVQSAHTEQMTTSSLSPSGPSSTQTSPNRANTRIFASPLARRLAQQAGLDLTGLRGSGPHGRLVKRDIEAAIAGTPSQIASPPAAMAQKTGTQQALSGTTSPSAQHSFKDGEYELVPLDGMRKTVARRLTESFRDTPHFPLNVDIELDALLALRKELNADAPDGVKISVNDMAIRASALALKHVPFANASYTDDGLLLHKHAHVAVAVAIEGGLITPVIRYAEQKGMADISAEMKDLAHRARERRLMPEEYQGGTFSLSNLGMFGVKSFSSILNPPQGMILSLGQGAPAPVVRNGDLAIATVMTATLTCDHRVVDGAVGARWLQAFKRFLEKPVSMLL